MTAEVDVTISNPQSQFIDTESAHSAALAALQKARDDFLLNAPINVPITRRSLVEILLQDLPPHVKEAVFATASRAQAKCALYRAVTAPSEDNENDC